jgi:mRNA-degrading endonuclease HigB of HigAB toxin-antitoxin module
MVGLGKLELIGLALIRAPWLGFTITEFPSPTSLGIAISVPLVTCKHLYEAMQQYPDAANENKAWVVTVKGVRWPNFLGVRSAFKDVDSVKGYVIFDIRQNDLPYSLSRSRFHVFANNFVVPSSPIADISPHEEHVAGIAE